MYNNIINRNTVKVQGDYRLHATDRADKLSCGTVHLTGQARTQQDGDREGRENGQIDLLLQANHAYKK